MKQLLFWFSRTWLGGLLIGWLIAHFSFAIPVDRIRETETLLAFHHPQPSHALHILIVPKERYRSFLDFSSDENTFIIDLFKVVKELVEEFNLEASSYRLVMNGGSNQEVKHLHFHLISDDAHL